VSGPSDLFKSLVRRAATAARRRLGGLGPVSRLRDAVREASQRRVIVHDELLQGALTAAPGVTSVMARARDGGLHVDATYADGSTLEVVLTPDEPRFAPHGPKELRFRVEPAELAGERRVHELVLATASAVARALWAPALRGLTDETAHPVVERDGDGARVDLRTLPFVRAALANRGTALLVEALDLVAIRADAGVLALELKLPGLGPAPRPR